jgi:hypothetical protein
MEASQTPILIMVAAPEAATRVLIVVMVAKAVDDPQSDRVAQIL